MRMWGSAILLSFLAGFASTSAAQDSKEVNAYIFGNSLVHHLTDSPETTVPYWLDRLAQARGHRFSVDGNWGFLRDFARNLPPEPNWSFPGVTGIWDSERLSFGQAGFDAILITPANFIQYQSAQAPYEWDNPDNDTPLAATGRVVDWARAQVPGARILIYQGWAEMAQIAAYPPNARRLAQYHQFNVGPYHEWYQSYVAALQAQSPGVEIDLIPVASVLSQILIQEPLSGIAVEDLYADDAPHGTANLYFLAALITYASLYDEAPPTNLDVPPGLHPIIRENYPQIADLVARRTLGSTRRRGDSLQMSDTGLADPSLAMGLNGISDWSTQQPFIDVMKSARPWIGHLPDQWGGWEFEQLQAGGYLDASGWPVAIPDGVTALEAFILTDQHPDALSLAGQYRVTWEGQGDLSVIGVAQHVRWHQGAIRFGYEPGEGLVAIRIEAVDPDDPIRNIRVIRDDLRPLYEAGFVFNPDWLARIRDLRMIRFMDWMFTNGSPQVNWEDRPRRDDFSYAWRGVPLDVMIDLSNHIGADPWFTLPHMADDAYARAFAAQVFDTLDPDLVVHAEWSNEVWNFLFPQAVWAREQALARWGTTAPDDAWMQFAGLRAAEIADIWSDVFAGHQNRLVRVVGTHSGWFGLENALLYAPLSENDVPAASFDAYAITGYFGFEIGDDTMTETLLGWIEDGTATEQVTAALREGSFDELTAEIFPYHAGVAERYGLDLLMYEGGTHVTGHGEQTGNEVLTRFYTEYNYSPEMAALYADLLTSWRLSSDQPFNAFVDVSAPSQFGSWGALRHLDDHNARWEALVLHNARPSGAVRDPDTFLHGVILIGGHEGDVMAGTAYDDVIAGLAGDDRIVTGGGRDRVNGGDGYDVVVLLGHQADYRVGSEDDRLVLSSDQSRAYLFAVEAVEFEDGGGFEVAPPN